LAWAVTNNNGYCFELQNDIYINNIAQENWEEEAKQWFTPNGHYGF
jgi:hypothetical protein